MNYSDFKVDMEPATEGAFIAAIAIIAGALELKHVVHVGRNKIKDSKFQKNLSEAAKLSIQNYTDSWVPAIKKWLDDEVGPMVQKWIDAHKYSDNYVSLSTSEEVGRGLYKGYDGLLTSKFNTTVLALSAGDWETDEIRDHAQELIKELKPLVTKLKASSKKFEPYFKLAIDEGTDEDEDSPYIKITLECQWIKPDRVTILKDGFPKYK